MTAARHEPLRQPTNGPTSQPTGGPTSQPASQPTNKPPNEPGSERASEPTSEPGSEPTSEPASELASADALVIEGLSAGYARRQVLRDLTAPACKPGTVVALVGPNGAGKSTLLRVLAGLRPARGHVRFGKLNLLTASASEHAARVAFMPQAIPERVSLTVFEAVLSAMRVASGRGGLTTSRADRERAVAILARVGLTEYAHRQLDQLSGGERQLASLAQALVRDPALLLLDEPTSALDLGHQVTVMSLVRELAAEGRLVLMVLHDLNLAVRWADRVIVLRDGRIDAIGAPIDALTPDVLARTYGVAARVERCSRGLVQILIDGRIVPAGTSTSTSGVEA